MTSSWTGKLVFLCRASAAAKAGLHPKPCRRIDPNLRGDAVERATRLHKVARLRHGGLGVGDDDAEWKQEEGGDTRGGGELARQGELKSRARSGGAVWSLLRSYHNHSRRFVGGTLHAQMRGCAATEARRAGACHQRSSL